MFLYVELCKYTFPLGRKPRGPRLRAGPGTSEFCWRPARLQSLPAARAHMRSLSSASSALAISSASELLPSSSLLDSLLDSLAASSSFSFLLWPLGPRPPAALLSLDAAAPSVRSLRAPGVRGWGSSSCSSGLLFSLSLSSLPSPRMSST